MQIVDSYPVIVTEAMTECRDFYVHWFDFDIAFEASWFVLLASPGEPPISIAFMHPEHPSTPPSPGPHRGDGSFLTFQVEDVTAEYDRLVAAGFRCELPLRDEPWGQRRFGVIDPAGMWIDVVEQIEPQDGWWDAYTVDR